MLLQEAYIVYDTYSKCCEPCSFCHVNILIQIIIQAFCLFYLTASRLAQLEERGSAEREVVSSKPDRTINQGL